MTTRRHTDQDVRRVVRRRWLAAAVLLTPLLYGSSFVTAAFLFGAGCLPRPVYAWLCETAFAPVFWIDGDSGRIGWLLQLAGDAYWLGSEARRW